MLQSIDFYVEKIIGSVNQTTGSSVQSLLNFPGPCNSASGFLFYRFAIKSIQDNQNLKISADPQRKIWEWHSVDSRI